VTSPKSISLVLVLCLFGFPRIGHLAPAKDHTLRGTVFGDTGSQEVPLAEVQVRCYGTDDTVHDDVVSPVTNVKGDFVAHIPVKYGTFMLVFVDIKSTYWPKQVRLSPTADPTGLGRIVLFPRRKTLSAADREDVEHIQGLLTATDPNLAQVLLANLNGQPTSDVLVADISGAGSTFTYPLYVKWADVYKSQTGVGVNYQSIGSGSGIKQITAKTVTFGASDVPLKPEELKKVGLIQFPTVIGGVVPIVNVKGISAGDLTLDGATLASIYMGTTVNWNDSRIKKLNPTLTLPNLAIVPIYRADGSGTTALISEYLSKASPRFKEDVGTGTSIKWPTGIAAKGDEGVANVTAQTPGGISYVEHAYAKKNGSTYVKLVNADGGVVTPTLASFTSAAEHTDWKNAPSNYTTLVNRPGADTWPITGASYILMYERPADPTVAAQALKFFDWAYKDGNGMAYVLDYATLPDNAKEAVIKTWKKVVAADGTPVLEIPTSQ